MRSILLLGVLPGCRLFYQGRNGFQLPAVPLYSLLFTVVLVHDWYMKP